METFVSFLDQWQTLIGAIIGGIFALLVALLVAYKARRQEDLAAAMLVVGNLVTIRTAARTLLDLAEEQEIKENEFPFWLSEKLARHPLILSHMFEASRVRLMPLDVHLAAHLEIFQVVFSDIQQKISVLAEDIAEFDVSEKTARNDEAVKADAPIIKQGFFTAAAHAECAERIITLKVLSNYPTYHSLRMRFFPSAEEIECKKLLAN